MNSTFENPQILQIDILEKQRKRRVPNNPEDPSDQFLKILNSGSISAIIVLLVSCPDHSCNARDGLMQGWESECAGVLAADSLHRK